MSNRLFLTYRTTCTALAYEKLLKLDQSAFAQTATGQIVNLMTNDLMKFTYLCLFGHYIWISPLLVAFLLVWLYQTLGWSIFVGCALLLLSGPAQKFVGNKFAKLRAKAAIITDERVKFMSEFIGGIRVVKLFSWESALKDRVMGVRSNEIDRIYQASVLKGINLVFFYVSGPLIAMSTLLPFFFAGNELTAPIVFGTITLFSAVSVEVALFFGLGIEGFSESQVTFSRLQKFLLLPETARVSVENQTVSEEQTLLLEKKDCCSDDTTTASSSSESVSLVNVCASWTGNYATAPTLSDVSFSASPSSLSIVCGPVGSGKTSLLMALMRELNPLSGSISLPAGKIAFASQNPWIMSGTVLSNIVLDSPVDRRRLNQIYKICALERDLESFPDGEETQIGEKGITLSGGQRARISLARAVYRQDTKLYLLDDPLSAVDPAVAKHLLRKCIKKFLVQERGATVILVTHQIQFLQQADQVIVIRGEGKVAAIGSYEELTRSGFDFNALLPKETRASSEIEQLSPVARQLHSPSSPASTHLATATPNRHACASPPSTRRRSSSRAAAEHRASDTPEGRFSVDGCIIEASISRATSVRPSEAADAPNGEATNKKTDNQAYQLVQEEDRATGVVTFGTYLKYMKASGGCFSAVTLLIGCTVAQFAKIAGDFWLSAWVEQPDSKRKDPVNAYIYAGLAAFLVIVAVLRTIFFIRTLLKGSKTLHDQMMECLTRAPIAFFDSNPIGRVLNRFSADIGVLDDLLPIMIVDFAQCLFMVIGCVCAVAFVTPWVLVLLAVLLWVLMRVRFYSLESSRDVKRLEGTTRSPVHSHVSATLDGIFTIRSYGMQGKFLSSFIDKTNRNVQALFTFQSITRWFGMTLDGISATFIAGTAVLAIMGANHIDPGLAGLSLTYSVMLMGMFQWCVRLSTEVENLMISVERVHYYTQLPSEGDLETSLVPEKEWPHKGEISIENVSLTYRKGLDRVLKNISCIIKPKQKIGIVGRTGAGKTSFLTALFRLVEPDGEIFIDEIPITKIGLRHLRQKLSIIPQEPVLWSGTIRFNIDPFQEHSDPVMWDAIQEVQLKHVLNGLEGLDTLVSEGGSNFSIGQRQLICLARAILRESKVLVMDEATANVDLETDAIIQRTIRKRFADCTVLVIAHRLNTIIDSDRVAVLDKGRLAEFGAPKDLLDIQDSLFSSMVKETGPKMEWQLKKAATSRYQKMLLQGPVDPPVRTGSSEDEKCVAETTIEIYHGDIDLVNTDLVLVGNNNESGVRGSTSHTLDIPVVVDEVGG